MWPLATEQQMNERLRRIRDAEWAIVEPFVREHVPGSFLDVGCGAGYAVAKAAALGLAATGVDSHPGECGVRDFERPNIPGQIVRAEAESLPFAEESFDVVHCAYVLEHVCDRNRCLAEMRRVLRREGRAIILVPTAAMAFLRILSLYLFCTHVALRVFLTGSRTWRRFREILVPGPHGTGARTAWGEVADFRTAKWKRLIARHFVIEHAVCTPLYPWPDFPQFFPWVRIRGLGSGVCFVCRKP